MKDPDSENNKGPKSKGAGPTRSFDGSVVGPGSQIGPFRIEQELGRGGAGVVYLAHDTKLDRSVAIKSLPAEVMENAKARSRFSREARLLASLNHPNIATIYEEFEEVEGVGYLILEYVPGQTLAERIAKKPLKLEEALTIALQIAEAVAAAHEHDVIHRDLKPGNIKITQEGKVKVLDFGLAKVVGGEATDQQTTITEPGRVIGTPAYMSPEQARGKPTDKRSDIWAFGCILYEMLTAKVPFKGETISDTLANILQTEPRWETLPENIPTNIRSLLRHCLKKDPRRRLQHIGDATIEIEDTSIELQRSTLRAKPVEAGRIKSTKWSRRALPWFITGTAMVVLLLVGIIIGLKLGRPDGKLEGKSVSGILIKPINAIVVLPFENLSGDPEQEYFVDGMTEELSTELGKISALMVKGQDSAKRYKGIDKQTSQIARELGVDAVITGSVFKAANNVRITAKLIYGSTEEQLWGKSYEGDLANVITLQREVALAIAKEIKVKLTPQEEERLATARPINPKAHDAYLKGRLFLGKRNAEGFKTAISHFEDAKNLDPNYAQAYVGLADCHILQGVYDVVSSEDVFPRAKDEAMQALAIDDSLGEAYNSLAYATMLYDWDWSEAELRFQKAIDLNPNYATVHHWYAVFLQRMGRFQEALESIKRAQELEPFSLIIRSEVGHTLGYLGKYDEAIEQLQQILQIDPDFLPAFYHLAVVYLLMPMFEENIAAFERVVMIRGRDATSVAWLAFAYAAAGKIQEAQTLLQEALDRSKEEYVGAWAVSVAYARLGDMDSAIKWLKNKIITKKDHSAVGLKTHPTWAPLRKDPRFNEVLKQMNFPETPGSTTKAKTEETADTPIEKIAVLPFTSISSEAGEEWFVDGMTVTLTTQLGKIKALTVISSRSAMELKGTSKPVREIARDLGVDGLIEGTVIRVGNKVQITAELIDGRRDEQIWADVFQGTFDDILALQTKVTLAIAKKIEVALTPEEKLRFADTKSINPDAYEAFLKGKFYFDRLTEENLKTAADYYKQAIEIEPDYTEAHVWLSFTYWVPSVFGYTAPHESFAKAKTVANKAIELDETCSEAHAAIGWIALFYDWDWEKAKLSLERAIELNPNFSRGYHGLAWYLTIAGRFNEAIDTEQTAVKLDPFAPNLNNHIATMYRYSGQVERVLEQRKKTLELFPDHSRAISDLARDYLSFSMYPEAVVSIEKAMSLAGRTPELVSILAQAYALSGRKDDAETLLKELKERATSEYVSAIYFAELYVALANKDEAFIWLEKAYEERNSGMLWLRMRSSWDPLRSDPRFDDFVQRMKYPE